MKIGITYAGGLTLKRLLKITGHLQSAPMLAFKRSVAKKRTLAVTFTPGPGMDLVFTIPPSKNDTMVVEI